FRLPPSRIWSAQVDHAPFADRLSQTSRPACLHVDGLSWGPPGFRHVLRDISFAVEPGEMLAVVGPNGAGKSSLLRCLYRYHRPTRGTVALDGTDIWTMRPRAIARRIATVLQEPA